MKMMMQNIKFLTSSLVTSFFFYEKQTILFPPSLLKWNNMEK